MKVNPAELWTYTTGAKAPRDAVNKVIQWNLGLPLSNHYTPEVVSYLAKHEVIPIKIRGKQWYKHIELTPVGHGLGTMLQQRSAQGIERGKRTRAMHIIRSHE